MTRVNLVLLLAVLASALYLVNVQYESRRLVTELDRAALEARRIEIEREQLDLARRQQASAQRVERLAKERLDMRSPTPAITEYTRYALAERTSSADGQAPSPAVSGPPEPGAAAKHAAAQGRRP